MKNTLSKLLLLVGVFLASSSYAQKINVPGGAPNYKPSVTSPASLPVAGNATGDARVSKSDSTLYIWDGAAWQSSGGGGGAAVWGSITGTLSSQTDLNTALNGKEPTITATTLADYYRGDKTFQTLNTLAVPELTNLYYTQTRFDTAFAAKTTDSLTEGATNLYFTNARARAATIAASISSGDTTHSPDGNSVFNALATKEPTVTATTSADYYRGDKTFQTLNTLAVPELTNLYYTQARFDTAFAAKNTDSLSEGVTNLYFTNARTLASILTGYTSGAGVLSAADTILSAIQKLNGNIGVISGSAITSLTGDGTATGPGASAFTLATVNATTGTFGSASSVPVTTVNGKGLTTNAVDTPIAIAESQVTNLVSDLALKAPLASPALTGVPTAPTASALTNTTQIATAAYVDSAVAVVSSSATAKKLFVSRDTGSDANACTINKPCLTIQHTIAIAEAIPSTFNTPVEIEVGPGKYTEDLTFSQQGITLKCSTVLYHTDACQLYGGITVNLSGTAGGGNFVASNNAVAINGLESYTSGAKNAILFNGTAFQRLFINQSFINQSTVNSANSALLMSNTGTSGGTLSTVIARDTDFSNSSSTNATIEQQAGRLFDNGVSLDLSNSSNARTAVLQSCSAAAGCKMYIDHASITGQVSMTDNTSIMQFSLVAIDSGTQSCVSTPASPNTGFFLSGDNIFTTSNVSTISGTGVAVLSGANFCGSTGCAIAGTVTQAPLSQLPQGVIKPSGVLVSGLSASLPVKTDASKNLVTAAINLASATEVTGTLAVSKGGTGITSFGTGIATFLGTPSSANLAAAITDETGTGVSVFGTSPTFTTSVILGTNAHLISTGTAPTTTVNANAGTSATCTVSVATDMAGKIQLITGSGAWVLGNQCAVNFNTSYGAAPKCSLTPLDSNTSSLVMGQNIVTSTTQLQVSFTDADIAATTYNWAYNCIQ